jgi:hypothetical protein
VTHEQLLKRRWLADQGADAEAVQVADGGVEMLAVDVEPDAPVLGVDRVYAWQLIELVRRTVRLRGDRGAGEVP